MAYRYGDRHQSALFPASIEEYVDQDAPVRAYDAIVDAFDFKQLGIELDEKKTGNSQYDPRTMLKLLVYGYSYGIKSSRKIERACYDNVSFMWLMGGLKPDHKTISLFRKNHLGPLKKALRQTAQICIRLNICDGNILFADGSKFRANASRDKIRSKKWCKKVLAALDERINALLVECERCDADEADQGTHAKMNKELAQTSRLKEKIEAALGHMQDKETEKINLTDPDSKVMKGRQGVQSSYNVQTVVDGKEGIILHAEAVPYTNDYQQFATQIENAMQVTGKKCDVSCADSGFCNIDELAKIDKKEILVVVPSKRQASHDKDKPFDKEKFVYDERNDCYYCPKGHRLRPKGVDSIKKATHYQIQSKALCAQCEHFGRCTRSKKGRKITRYDNELLRQRFEKQYEQSIDTYKLRKQKVELPFGHMKRNLGFQWFLLRGIEQVQGEIALLSSCFNIVRMIGKLGVRGLIEQLCSLKAAQPA